MKHKGEPIPPLGDSRQIADDFVNFNGQPSNPESIDLTIENPDLTIPPHCDSSGSDSDVVFLGFHAPTRTIINGRSLAELETYLLRFPDLVVSSTDSRVSSQRAGFGHKIGRAAMSALGVGRVTSRIVVQPGTNLS